MTQINVIFSMKKDKVHIELLAITNKNTVSEELAYQSKYTISKENKDEWLEQLKNLYQVCSGSSSQVDVRFIVKETDVITSTTTKLSKKDELRLLKDNITMSNHQMFVDMIYYLKDADYYIISLVNVKLLSMVKRAQAVLELIKNKPTKKKSNPEFITVNRLILGLINNRADAGRDTSDYGIVIGNDGVWEVYIVAIDGIPFRILEAKTEEEVESMLDSGNIEKGILISCGNRFFGLKSVTKIHRGQLSNNQDTILYLGEPVDKNIDIDVTTDSLLLLPNSIDYEKISKWLLPQRVVIMFSVIFIIITTIVSTICYFALSEDGFEMINEKMESTIGFRLTTPTEESRQLKESVEVLMNRMGIQADSITVRSGVVTIRFESSSQNRAIMDMAEVLRNNYYIVDVEIDETTGNEIVRVQNEELDTKISIDIDDYTEYLDSQEETE